MKKISLVLLALAGFAIHSNAASNYAVRVVSYNPGANPAPGYTNKSAILGEPTRVNPFGDVDPFNPPYGTDRVLSIGEGGWVVAKMDRPIFDTPRKPFGLDFIIFGNTGFIITNDFDPMTYEWIGTPATDGSTFGFNPGTTLVSVSADGINFVPLSHRFAPTVDGLFPTDPAGRFDLPVNPALKATNFAGATGADIRELYNGSAGGTGYNVNWAQWRGRWVRLPFVRYIRIDVLAGTTEIDAISAVARTPKPRR